MCIIIIGINNIIIIMLYIHYIYLSLENYKSNVSIFYHLYH